MAVYDDDAFDSPEEAIAHYKELLKVLQARRRELDSKVAQFNYSAPHHVVTELAEVNIAIVHLIARVKDLESTTSPTGTGQLPGSEIVAISALDRARWESLRQWAGQFSERVQRGNWQAASPEEVQNAVLSNIVLEYDAFVHPFPKGLDLTVAKPVIDEVLAENLNMSIEMVHATIDDLKRADLIREPERRFIPDWTGDRTEKVRAAVPTDNGRSFVHRKAKSPRHL
jgi:hypothetical protein